MVAALLILGVVIFSCAAGMCAFAVKFCFDDPRTRNPVDWALVWIAAGLFMLSLSVLCIHGLVTEF